MVNPCEVRLKQKTDFIKMSKYEGAFKSYAEINGSVVNGKTLKVHDVP